MAAAKKTDLEIEFEKVKANSQSACYVQHSLHKGQKIGEYMPFEDGGKFKVIRTKVSILKSSAEANNSNQKLTGVFYELDEMKSDDLYMNIAKRKLNK